MRRAFFSGMFVRFFAGIWIMLLLVGGIVWATSAFFTEAPRNYGSFERGPGAERALGSALGILRWGGEDALIRWLRDPEVNKRPEVFVINAEGREISGRPLPPGIVEKLPEAGLDEGVITLSRHGNGHRMRSFAGYRIFSVRTDIPPSPLKLLMWRMPWWGSTLMALLISVMVAGGFAWSYTCPIKKLQWAMQKTSQGDFDVRVAAEVGHKNDEIGELARQFDAMAERIHGLFDRQKRLFHDVSHELRSPLARIAVAVELAEKSPEKSREFLHRIEGDAQVLNAMVDELLTYTRLDENAPIQFELTDLVPLLEAITDDADFEGSANGTRVTLNAPESIPMNMHVDSLMRAVENLVRNALRYSGPGQQVHVQAKEQNAHVVISVTDSGPGMNPYELEKIFEPFVRGKNQPTGGGFGLGLAIAKRAVERHGGTIRAHNVEPHGLCMTIDIPPSGPEAAAAGKAS